MPEFKKKNQRKRPVEKNKRQLLRLFISGAGGSSLQAKNNFMEMYESELKDYYLYEIIDILEYPEVALEYNVFVVPMLIKDTPQHKVNIIGNLEDKEKVLITLQISAQNE
ncbi:hypothetical protein JWG39_15200 [Desulforhopalus vacuolatus]|uniref:circadian clock KaiB family protein n=1 Tax=Desulforhopalus vacuolatus TaxID=40414 RepID=UPI00196462EA|nr:circadian clock KaiB family protein [Desulforhopalus vacuolatus]MBM9521167.1 hypothetical protein [Desulforhopalus vacuolatus]